MVALTSTYSSKMKLIYLVSAFALTLTIGCNTQPETAETPVVEAETKVIEKETVRVVEAPAKEVMVEKESGTTIQVGPDGGSLKTKKVDIKVNN